MGYNGGKGGAFQTGQDIPSSNKVTLPKGGQNYDKDSNDKGPELPPYTFCGHEGRGPTGRDEKNSGSDYAADSE